MQDLSFDRLLMMMICMVVRVGPLFTGKYTVGGILGYTNQNFYPMIIFISVLEVKKENGVNCIIRMFMCNWHILVNILRVKLNLKGG